MSIFDDVAGRFFKGDKYTWFIKEADAVKEKL